MLKRLKLYYKLNKFYKIFGEALGTVSGVTMRDLKDDFVLSSCAFDVAEAIEGYADTFNEDSYTMSRWLGRLFEDLCGKNANIY